MTEAQEKYFENSQVQDDNGKVFDLIADVEKQHEKKDGYIYTLTLRENINKGIPCSRQSR